MKSKSNKIYLI